MAKRFWHSHEVVFHKCPCRSVSQKGINLVGWDLRRTLFDAFHPVQRKHLHIPIVLCSDFSNIAFYLVKTVMKVLVLLVLVLQLALSYVCFTFAMSCWEASWLDAAVSLLFLWPRPLPLLPLLLVIAEARFLLKVSAFSKTLFLQVQILYDNSDWKSTPAQQLNCSTLGIWNKLNRAEYMFMYVFKLTQIYESSSLRAIGKCYEQLLPCSAFELILRIN